MTEAATGPTDSRRGILWMILAMLMFISMDSLVKHLLQQSYPVAQVVWARYTFHVVLLLVLVNRRAPRAMLTRHPVLQLLRSLLLLVTTTLFFIGLGYVPLADACAVMLLGPVIVTALSGPLLKENVGSRRWIGVAIGFAGAIVIIRPGTGMMQAGALFPLAAAFHYAFYQISTRWMSQSDSTLTTVLYTAVAGALVTSVVVPFNWVAPQPIDWMWMVASGIFGGAGHFALIKAFTAAPASTITPFGYTNLLWATLFGFVFFAELPDRWTVFGASIVVASGLYIFSQERIRRQRR
jgi:drug/metabolite transporter (DMT)-like permease